MESERHYVSVSGEYPPLRHMLRDLLISVEFEEKTRCTVRAPVVPQVGTDRGGVQVGDVATRHTTMAQDNCRSSRRG